ncbi:uncharacterized protein LOC113272987 [Papaver somniferum]|uniref:uncharacterized protein LOC113272987 n=1 Tax=Papaver somniferum TaxID=3469 RepID=UPI000E6FF19D|nr:uncharacterized protein LOC113272987 [Papaver somniferum]
MTDDHECAIITVHGKFLGGQAKINLWNPTVETTLEISVSQIWAFAGPGTSNFNSIEAGWETDSYINSCTNLECEGFVQISPDIALGCSFTEMSTFKGDQKDATFSIHKDPSSGNWWIEVQGTPVGYHPISLFTILSKTPATMEFGGEIFNERSKGRHTTAQMGSGHFSSEGGLGVSSYFHHVQVIDENNEVKNP